MQGRQRTRAFSLIEVAVVVAILGVAASLAIPNLLPLVHQAQIEGAQDGAANFLARARAEAMLSKRCVRVTRAGSVSLLAERFNTFDCEAATPGGPFIDNTNATPFLLFDAFKPESPNVTFTITTFPAATAATNEIRFRPSGRVFSNDASVTNDDAVIALTHGKLTGAKGTARILIEGNGLICTIKRGSVPAGTSPNFTCP
jgi:prepilin-type N-terminal cleavage/methylation domain-containing protein